MLVNGTTSTRHFIDEPTVGTVIDKFVHEITNDLTVGNDVMQVPTVKLSVTEL